MRKTKTLKPKPLFPRMVPSGLGILAWGRAAYSSLIPMLTKASARFGSLQSLLTGG